MFGRSWTKRLLAAVTGVMLAAGTLCFSMPASAATSVEAANIRSVASTDGEKLGVIYPGNEVTVLGETTGTDGELWYHIQMVTEDGETIDGYVKGSLLTGVDEAVQQEDAGEPEEEPEGEPEEAVTEEVQQQPAQAEAGQAGAEVVQQGEDFQDPGTGENSGAGQQAEEPQPEQAETPNTAADAAAEKPGKGYVSSAWRTAAIINGIIALAAICLLILFTAKINKERAASKAGRAGRRNARAQEPDDGDYNELFDDEVTEEEGEAAPLEEDSEGYEEESGDDLGEEAGEGPEDEYYTVVDRSLEKTAAPAKISADDEVVEEVFPEDEAAAEEFPEEGEAADTLPEDEAFVEAFPENEPETEAFPEEENAEETIPGEEEAQEAFPEEGETKETSEAAPEEEEYTDKLPGNVAEEEDYTEVGPEESEEVYEEVYDEIEDEEDLENPEGASRAQKRSKKGAKGAAGAGVLGSIGGFFKKVFAAEDEEDELSDDLDGEDEELEEEDIDDELGGDDFDDLDEKDLDDDGTSFANAEFEDGDPDDFRIFDDHKAWKKKKSRIEEFEEDLEDELRDYPEDKDLLPAKGSSEGQDEDEYLEVSEEKPEKPAAKKGQGLTMQKVMRNVRVREEDDFIEEELRDEDLESVLFDDDDDMEYSFLGARRR